jgi:hypothetical protein
MGIFNWLLGDFTSDNGSGAGNSEHRVYKNEKRAKAEQIRKDHKQNHGGSGAGGTKRERNVGHSNGEEHSRNTKGSNKTSRGRKGGQPRK